MKKDYWKIKPHTRTKLKMLQDIFNIWLTIWNAPRQQEKVSGKEWYVLDLFAGRGWYDDENGKEVSGSPLVFLERILLQEDKLRRNHVKIKFIFVEKNRNYIKELKEKIGKFLTEHSSIKQLVEIKFYEGDCNEKKKEIAKQLRNHHSNPIFLFIDPWGINVKKETIKFYLNLSNPIDILFNFSEEGVRRTKGVALKIEKNQKEVKITRSLEEFLGKGVDYKTKHKLNILKDYAKTLFIANMYHVVGFDMEYPSRKDIIYYLLFASKSGTIAKKIVKDVFARYKERTKGPSLFGREFYFNSILELSPECKPIPRRTLLYKTKVEYGDWTINHIIGCKHGCKFPCYAMRMAQKFGWVKDYKDWRKPRIARNALEILEKEIPKYKNEINFVHLCFMSDPFMYDYETDELVPEVKELTLKIIERLNKERIKVTTLTKGFYPDEILDRNKFLSSNEYGITLVSLSEEFKKQFEPFSAPYEKRIKSLEKLAKAGLKTWVSMEPYPTPDLDETSVNVEMILERIKFVKKIIFGKLNYRRLSDFDPRYYKLWKNNTEFYEEIAKKVINFCKKHNIKYHIKFGTPLSKQTTINIFNE